MNALEILKALEKIISTAENFLQHVIAALQITDDIHITAEE